MIARGGYELPEEQRQELARARRLARWSLFWLVTITVVMFLTMGSSQAMKTAWVEDVLSLVPPVVFLLASGHERKAPRERFPYGYHRLSSIAFLAASTALTFVGAFLVYESVTTLVAREHPTIGAMELFGHTVWSGWVMIAALVYSVVPPVMLARRKQPLAKRLHQKALFADADMNRADWATGLAGILGIAGVGFGFWWADAVAAGFIALGVTRDGLGNLKGSVEDLVDRRPVTVESGEPDPLIEELVVAFHELPWVAEADVRLREEGAVLVGEVYLVPVEGALAGDDVVERLAEAARLPHRVHWRFYDVVPTLVASLEELRHGEEYGGTEREGVDSWGDDAGSSDSEPRDSVPGDTS